MNSNSNQGAGEIQAILGEAAAEGVISPGSLQVIDIDDTVLAGAGGIDIDEIVATEVILMTFIYDDSGSISFAGLAGSVIIGQNEMIDSIAVSKQKDGILMAQWKLGSAAELVHSYLPIDQAAKLDGSNYDPRSGTALYDVWLDALAANVAYAQKLRSGGIPVRSIAAIITDGMNEHSRKYDIGDCRRVNQELLMSEQFALAFVGVGNSQSDEDRFRQVALEMGFPDGSILTASGMTEQERKSAMRRVFGLVSQSAIRASQKAGNANSFFNG